MCNGEYYQGIENKGDAFEGKSFVLCKMKLIMHTKPWNCEQEYVDWWRYAYEKCKFISKVLIKYMAIQNNVKCFLYSYNAPNVFAWWIILNSLYVQERQQSNSCPLEATE